MVKWREFAWMGLLVYLTFTVPTSVRSQSTVSAQELWTYGRGEIQDFDWSEPDLTVSTGSRFWQIDPLSGQSPTQVTADVFRLSTSPDGLRFVTREQNEILIHDAHTGEVIARIPRSYGGSDWLAWQPNTNLLATPGYNKDNPPERQHYVELWNTVTGEVAATVGGYADNIIAFSWHPAGDLLAVSLASDTIIIENVERGEEVRELRVGNSADAIAWSPDGSQLAAKTNAELGVMLWRTDTLEPIIVESHPPYVMTLGWNSDSIRLAGALPGSGVGVWNVETGELTSLGGEADDGIDRVVEHIAWHGNLLAALDRTRRLRVWNVGDGELVWDSTEHQFQNSVGGIAVSRNGEFVALGYDNSREIDILDGATGALIQTLQAPRRLDITDMAWSPSGEQLAVSDNGLLIWSFGSNESADPIEVDDVDDMSWSPDGEALAVSSYYHRSDELRLIDAVTGEELNSLEVPKATISQWSPDGQYIAIFRYNPPSEDGTIPPYQIDIWQWQRNLTATVNFPRSDENTMRPSQGFLWLPDSSGLIGYTDQGTLWHWPVGYQEAEIIVQGPPMDAPRERFRLSINARGDLLAVSTPTADWQLQILDAETGALLLAFDDLASAPGFFAWGGDDRLFVYDGILHAYQIR